MELIISPGMVFLDEPTTGLDSATATSVVNLLKEYAYVSIIMCNYHFVLLRTRYHRYTSIFTNIHHYVCMHRICIEELKRNKFVL